MSELARIERCGALVGTFDRARELALDVLDLVPEQHNATVSDTRRRLRAIASGREPIATLRSLRELCWAEEERIACDGVPPHKNERVAALRVAICAASESFGGDATVWLEYLVMFGLAAGVPNGSLVAVLRKHYGAPPNNKLQRTLRGEARLSSVMPNELDIVLTPADALGHIAVTGHTGYDVQMAHTSYWHAVHFGFQVEPTQLDVAAKVPWVTEHAA